MVCSGWPSQFPCVSWVWQVVVYCLRDMYVFWNVYMSACFFLCILAQTIVPTTVPQSPPLPTTNTTWRKVLSHCFEDSLVKWLTWTVLSMFSSVTFTWLPGEYSSENSRCIYPDLSKTPLTTCVMATTGDSNLKKSSLGNDSLCNENARLVTTLHSTLRHRSFQLVRLQQL